MVLADFTRSTAIFLTAALVSIGGPAASTPDEASSNKSTRRTETASPPNFEALKNIPLIVVIEKTAIHYTLFLAEPGVLAPHSQNEGPGNAYARIESLDPELRRLIWLTWVLDCWGSDKAEGLHTFFYLWGGDYASKVRDALFESGLFAQDRIFRQAIAAFGPVYPDDRATRTQFFAWSQPATVVDATTSIPQPLNAFDRKIMALSVAFGSRDEYGRAVEDFVRRTPRLAAWAAQSRAQLSDDDRLEWLTERLAMDEPKKMAVRIAAWPKAYRLLYLLDLFNGEMLNGGVHQFFSNSSGDLAPQVAAALREAGLAKHAEAVQKGIEMFAPPYPVDRQVRGRYFFVNGQTTDWDNKLDALTGEVDDGAIGAAMLAIAKQEGILPK
jgi:hypothetical protein